MLVRLEKAMKGKQGSPTRKLEIKEYLDIAEHTKQITTKNAFNKDL